MAESDVLLTLGFNATDAYKTAEQLQKEVQNIFNSRQGKTSSAMTSLEIQMKKNYETAARLREQMAEIAEIQVPTDEYAQLNAQLNELEGKSKDLSHKMRLFEESGGDTNSVKYQQWNKELTDLGDKVIGITDKMWKMEQSGTAFISGRESAKYQQLAHELDVVNDKLKQQIIHHREMSDKSIPKTTAQVKKLQAVTEKTRKASQGVAGNFSKGLSGATKSVGRLVSKFALLFLGFRGLYSLLMKIRSAILQGFSNLRESGVGRLKEQMNDLTNACTTLKNALAGAFEPIVTSIIPYIQRLIEWLTVAIDKLAQFIAAMKGQTTYIKAIKQVGDASKKANQELSKLDNLNVLTSQKNGAAGMFEEAQIADEMIDRVAELKKKIEEIHQWLDEHIFTPVKGFIAWFVSPITDNLDKIKEALGHFWDFVKARLDWIRDKINHVAEVIKGIYDEYIKPSLDKIMEKISYFFGKIVDFYNNHYEEFEWLAQQVEAIWDESIQPIIDAALELLGSLFALITDFIFGGDIDTFFDNLEAYWNWWYPHLQTALLVIRAFVKIASEKIVEFITNARKGADNIRLLLEKTGSRWTTFKIIVSAVVDKIKEKFNQMREDIYTITHYGQEEFGALIYLFESPLVVAIKLAKKAFDKLSDAVQRLVDLIKELTGFDLTSELSPLKQIIDKIDWDALKGMRNSFVTGGVFGGISFGRGMASGGVIPPNVSEHLVRVGDNNHETEVVSPLSTMQEAMVNALEAMGFNGNQQIVINLDGKEFMNVMVKRNNEYKKSHGGRSALA